MNQTTIRFTNGEKSFLSKEPLALCDIASLMSETGQNRRSTYVSTENMMKNYQGVVFDNSDELVNGIIYKPGDVLVSNIRPYLKKAWLADRCGVCSSDVLCIRPNDGIKSSYLFSLIARDSFFTNMMRAAKGSKMPRGDKENTMAFPVNFCTESEEQEKIGGFFTELDNLISAAADEVAALEEAKKGMMQKIFSREIRFKRDDGTEYPDWEEANLSEYATVIMGQSPEGSSVNDDGDGEYLIQGKADLRGYGVLPDRCTNKPTKICEPTDIIMTVRAPVGFVTEVGYKACIGRGVCAIRAGEKTSSQFIKYVLESVASLWRKIEQGTTFTAISADDVESLMVNIPCLEEQQKIADFLSSMDDAIAAAKDELTGYRELKRGLLQQMFA